MSIVVCLLSGGMDSSTLLYQLLQEHTVVALGINYGQRHAKELESARLIAKRAMVPYKTLDLSNVREFISNSSQTSDIIDVPDGHYEDESMKLTVVPNRNMIMLSIAVGWAISLGAESVAYAAHSGDHAIYPDCRVGFINAFREAARVCHYSPVKLITPFQRKTKADICTLGHDMGVPFELTWSCYKGQEKHCGRCGTCVERALAFKEANIADPTDYMDYNNPHA